MDFAKGEVIAINKPYGMSSFGALARVRGILSRRLGVKRLKTGHAGTLDPLATGVLILCTGRATKRIEEFQACTKEYTATLQLGATTPSYDMEHPVEATYPTGHITKELIDEVLQRFKGDISQVPPAYSACKINGKRAYKLRRKGRDVELAPKIVRIDSIDITAFDAATMRLSLCINCGKGTYVRALARDIGRELGSGAYLTELCRTRVGDIHLADCLNIEDIGRWLDENLEANTTDNNNEAITV